MSEIEGYVLAHSNNDKTFEDMISEFKKNQILELNDDKYQVWDVKTDSIIDIYFYTSEYADTTLLSKYIIDKYEPDILISSFDNKAFIDGKKVDRKKAFSALSKLSPKIGFYLNVEYGKYKEAFKIINENEIDLTDKISGVPNFERCFFGDYSPLMEYAIDRGYHDHYCQYDEKFPFDKDGVHILHRIVQSSSLDLIEKVLNLGASPNGINGDNESLLHNIAWYAFNDEFTLDAIELINMLAKYGADFNAKDWEGKTPILSIFSEIEDKLDEDHEKIVAIIDLFIKHGASVDIFDKSGAGLLTYSSGHDDIQSIFLKVNPNLEYHTDNFDINSYVKDRAYIRDRNLPRDYDGYFCKCIELDFIDFMLKEEQISIIKSLDINQLTNILMKVVDSKSALNILTSFIENDIPVFIEQNIEGSAEEDQDVQRFNYPKNIELVRFYEDIKDRKYNKIVLNYSSSSWLMNTSEIVSVG